MYTSHQRESPICASRDGLPCHGMLCQQCLLTVHSPRRLNSCMQGRIRYCTDCSTLWCRRARQKCLKFIMLRSSQDLQPLLASCRSCHSHPPFLEFHCSTAVEGHTRLGATHLYHTAHACTCAANSSTQERQLSQCLREKNPTNAQKTHANLAKIAENALVHAMSPMQTLLSP